MITFLQPLSCSLTASRSSSDSSPKMIRPWQSTTTTPSTVRELSFSCIRHLSFFPAENVVCGTPEIKRMLVPCAELRKHRGSADLRLATRNSELATQEANADRIKVSMAYQVLARKYRPQRFS